MTDAGIYVFGIVTADHPCHVEGVSGVGAIGAAIWRMAAWNTAAAVSAAPPQLRAKRRHHHSPAAVHAQLRELARQLEAGMISESEFDQAEDELLDRLSTAPQRARLADRNDGR